MIDLDVITIAAIKETDAWDICNFMVANEDRLKLYFPKTLAQNLTPSLAQHFTVLKVKQFASKEELLFTIKEKASGTLIGLVYIKEIDWNTKQGEYAYCIGYQYEGQGLMTKTIKALSDYAFNTLGLNTLQIISHKSNKANVKTAENCGFNWIKTLPKAYTPPLRDPLDMELYELYHDNERSVF